MGVTVPICKVPKWLGKEGNFRPSLTNLVSGSKSQGSIVGCGGPQTTTNASGDDRAAAGGGGDDDDDDERRQRESFGRHCGAEERRRLRDLRRRYHPFCGGGELHTPTVYFSNDGDDDDNDTGGDGGGVGGGGSGEMKGPVATIPPPGRHRRWD